MTLAELIERIASDTSIPPKRRNELCSGVRSLCRAMCVQPESTLADPRLLATKLRELTPTAARMSEGRLQNCRSYMDAALSLADTRFRRRRTRTPLAAHLEAFLSEMPNGWQRKKLRRFMHFLNEHKIRPEDVCDEVFDRFRESLNLSLIRDIRTTDREARKIWNALVTSKPEHRCQPVTVPRYTDHYVLPESAFPLTLWADVEAYIASRTKKPGAELDDILSEEELFSEEDKAHAQPIRSSTANLIRYRIRQLASALVLSNHLAPGDVTSLEMLTAPRVVMDGLNFFIKRAGGQRRNSQVRGMAYDFLMIAQHWHKRPEAELKVLRKIAISVRPEHQGLSEATRRKLAPFRDIENVRAFLAFPEKVFRDAQKEESISGETANRVATALWIKIAQRAPLRISNLLCTSLEHNVLRSHAGKNAKLALFYPPEVVKTKKPLEIPLPESTVKLLETYLTKYRPALVEVPTNSLFPASNGEPKRASVMSSDMQKLMREYLGFAINPHCYRHLAAKLYLTAHPGRYHDVQLLLGHKRVETTMQYYVDLQAEEAFRHFDTMLLGLEDGGALRTSDRRRA